MSANNIKSAEVFDNRFSYYDFMYCYHHVRNFCLTLETVIQKLNECSETLDEDMAQKYYSLYSSEYRCEFVSEFHRQFGGIKSRISE